MLLPSCFALLRRTGEGDNPKKFCLLPFEEWEKVPDRADEGLAVFDSIGGGQVLVFLLGLFCSRLLLRLGFGMVVIMAGMIVRVIMVVVVITMLVIMAGMIFFVFILNHGLQSFAALMDLRAMESMCC